MKVSTPPLPARAHLLLLNAAALIPVWLFAAYLLIQYAVTDRSRIEREALQVARQVSLVVDAELTNLLTIVEGIAASNALAAADLAAFYIEAKRVAQDTERTIVLEDLNQTQIINTQLDFGLPQRDESFLSATNLDRLNAGDSTVSGVFKNSISNEYRVAVTIPVRGPQNRNWLLSITTPTSRIHTVMLPAVLQGWVVGVGDRAGAYVARSQKHDEMTGKPGLPEYVAKIVGSSGTFTSSNFEGTSLLAGYFRSEFSGWFYTANVPWSIVEAPLWRSVAAVSAIGLLAMLLSIALAYVVGKNFAAAAQGLAARAEGLGQGLPVAPLSTAVSEFAIIADALAAAGRSLSERESELRTVLDTVPAAVWFTYDPQARQVIRNRFAAELMGLSTESRATFGTPDLVIDTVAVKDGHTVGREDRPLSRAMRGERTDNEEFSYTLPNGVRRVLLSSARPIPDDAGTVIGAVQISLDITERKLGEEQRKLLVNELNHRVKNTLAVVQSITTQTLRSARDLPEANRALSSRLISLARAHDILTQESWSGADLKELIDATLAPHAEMDRFRINGEAIWLAPSVALSLSLALHELATNAIKYGALSMPGGEVSLSWSTDSRPTMRRLQIEWRESGGPPVSPKVHRGFGSRLLERIFAAEPGSHATLKFEEAGVVCLLQVDLGVDAPGIAAT